MAGVNRTRIPASPALTPQHLVGRRCQGDEVVSHEVSRTLPYGYGKTAFRDAIWMLGGGRDANVLLPAYVPDGVVAAVRDADVDPRFYAIERDLGPDLADVDAKLDDRTVAATFVHYFGFPGERFDAFRRTVSEYGGAVVSDNAHAMFSSDGERRLGTGGVVGFTSLRKTLPVPNGALLYVDDVDGVDLGEAALSGRAERVTAADCRFALASLLAGAGRRSPAVCRVIALLRRLRDRAASVGGTASDGESASDGGTASDDGAAVEGETESERDPAAIYRRTKVRMSRLSTRVLRRTEPASVVDARRNAYRAWAHGLAGVPGVEPCFDVLPAGVAPQVFPVVADDPDAFLDRLARHGVAGAHTWPPLPKTVAGNDAFPTANALAASLVAVPCHQDVDPGAVESVCACIRSDR